MASASNGASVATVTPADVGHDDTGDGDFVMGADVVIVTSRSPMIRRIILYAATGLSFAICSSRPAALVNSAGVAFLPRDAL